MRVTSEMSAALAELSERPAQLKRGAVIKDIPVLPFEETSALRGGISHWRFFQAPFQPNLKEVIVAIAVMVVTVAVSLSGMALVAQR